MVTSQLESLGALGLERYLGWWEGQVAGDKRLFAFLLGSYKKGPGKSVTTLLKEAGEQ